MHTLSRLSASIALLLPSCALAQQLSGQVVNNQGNPIANATIEVEGTPFKARSNSEGFFELTDLNQGAVELHIKADGFAHLHKDLNLNQDNTRVTFELERSVIEVIDVVATPLHMSVMESATPVSVLAGEQLRREQAATLGDSLESVPGVNTNFHGNVASTPIIRGLSGPRVMITQNGLDVSDVSRVGPDHSVASEVSTAKQIEILRGPATLFYGSGAIGGVVNIVDSRVPTSTETRGEWLAKTESVNNEKLASFNANSGLGSFAFYADGYWRESDDYEVPVEAESHDDHEHDHEHEEEHHGDYKVDNSAEKSNGLTLGTSYLFDKGYVGASVEQLNREYGIPGHSHGDVGVHADLEQTRVQVLSEYNFDNDLLSKVNVRGGYSDYEHAEIEGGLVGTIFENETHELKVDLLHATFAHWNGGISFQYKRSDIAAQGAEAFTPPSEAETWALGFMEERHFGDFLVQLGARIEHVSLDADNVLLPHLDAHGHGDEDEHDHDHDHDHGHDSHSLTRVFEVEQDFTPTSLSAGVVWDFTEGYNMGLSVSRSERAPSAPELLSFGPHIGTGTYEVGALFALYEDEHGAEIGLTDQTIDLETANNIDFSLRKTQGDVGFVFNAFYNQVDNYYYQTNTQLFADDGHNHDHGDDHGHDDHAHDDHDEHEGELPVYIFEADDVILHGFEAQVAWQATDSFKATVFSDYVRARLKDGGDLPRTPPLRFGTQLDYNQTNYSAHLDITRYQEQDRVAPGESATDGYTMVDVSVYYHFNVGMHDLSMFLEASNLTDTEARVHSSFLKDIAPRPGRSIGFGITGQF